METFRQMVNESIKIGLEHDASTLRRLSSLGYHKLSRYHIYSRYKLCAISHAAGILKNRKKSIRRGLHPKEPYSTRPLLISCYGFKIVGCVLKIPLGRRRYYDIPLNRYVGKALCKSSVRIHSFILTLESVSICFSNEVQEIELRDVVDVDRNLRNLTVGNRDRAIQYDITKAVDIVQTTLSIMRFIKAQTTQEYEEKLYRKYGRRRSRRVNRLIHRMTKAIVHSAKQDKTGIVFEDLRHIRKLYQRGNHQGRIFRGRMNNGWSFAEVKRQIIYKARWEGVPTIQLSESETRGTSQLCPRCGKKITQVDRKARQLWCGQCKEWMDRDVVAAMNISIRGLQRFCSSNKKGLAGETMKGNPMMPVILRVDASKLAFRARV